MSKDEDNIKICEVGEKFYKIRKNEIKLMTITKVEKMEFRSLCIYG